MLRKSVKILKKFDGLIPALGCGFEQAKIGFGPLRIAESGKPDRMMDIGRAGPLSPALWQEPEILAARPLRPNPCGKSMKEAHPCCKHRT
jgi:hypothetical protein